MSSDPKAVLHREAIDSLVADLAALAETEAQRMKRVNPGRVFKSKRSKPDVKGLLTDYMRASLEDEVVEAVQEPPTTQPIAKYDLEREVIKKALVGLKLPTMRRIAIGSDLPVGGSAEELAIRIAQHYRWNDEEIARLVLANEAEPEPSRGHEDRLFPVASLPSREYIQRRLDYVIGRYIRVGIARWFVFDDVRYDASLIRLVGRLRAYTADVIDEEVETESPSLRPRPVAGDRNLEIIIPEDADFVQVRRASSSEGRAAVAALTLAAHIETVGRVAIPRDPELQGPIANFDPISIFLLDVLSTRLRHAGLRNPNLMVARFSLSQEDRDEEGDDRPRLRAVRFDGQHLLDSAIACRLLADEQRALVEVSVHVETQPRPDDGLGRFPVRVGVERDHLHLLTGYGSRLHELSATVHRAVRQALEEAWLEGPAEPLALSELGRKIAERAGSRTPQRADLLAVVDTSES